MGITYFLCLQTLIQRFIRTNKERSSSDMYTVETYRKRREENKYVQILFKITTFLL